MEELRKPKKWSLLPQLCDTCSHEEVFHEFTKHALHIMYIAAAVLLLVGLRSRVGFLLERDRQQSLGPNMSKYC